MLREKVLPLIAGSILALNTFSGSLNAQNSSFNTSSKFDIEDVICLEQDYGLKGANKAKRRFKKVYAAISKQFVQKSNYALNDAKQFFSLVADELEDNHIYPSNNNFITPALAKKNSYLDCDNFSLLYVSLASRLNLPVHPVYAKDHVFVRWDFKDGTYYNWDARGGTHKDDLYYKIFFGVSDQTENNGLYLSSISLEKALAPLYLDFSIDEYNKKDFPNSLKFINEALSLDSSFINAYFQKARILKAQDNIEGAIKNYDLARNIDSLDIRSYIRKGNLLIDEGDFSRAVVDLEKFLNKGDLEVYPLLIKANLGAGDFEEAKKLYGKLLDIGTSKASRYLLDSKNAFANYNIKVTF